MVRKYVRWGAGPRAGQALILGAKAHALVAGRFAVAPTDILRVARPVLRHRVLPNFAAEAKGITAEQIIDRGSLRPAQKREYERLLRALPRAGIGRGLALAGLRRCYRGAQGLL